MKRHVLVLAVVAACQQQIDLGVTPQTTPDAAASDQPFSSTGATGSTGVTGATGSTGNTGHGSYTASVIGAWVRPLATAGAYDRMSFGRDNVWVSTTDPLQNTALTYDVKYFWQGPMHLDWVSAGATARAEERLVFAYFWRDERYPYLAWGAYEQASGTPPSIVGQWNKVWVETSSAGTDTWTQGFDFHSDGSVTTTLSVVGPSSTNATLIPGHGTWACPGTDLCTVTFGGSLRDLHRVDGKLIDVANDRWEHAKTCGVTTPITWTRPGPACLPYLAVCQEGQTADWDGCNWGCVWAQACERSAFNTCMFDQDCLAGETCDNSLRLAVGGGAEQGLCVKTRTLCTMGGPNVCAAGESCSDTLCPPNTTCSAQCLVDR